MIPNRAAFLELEPTGMTGDELWEITGFARCDDCRYLMRAVTLVALPDHRCAQRQQLRRETPAQPDQGDAMQTPIDPIADAQEDDRPEPCGENSCHCYCATQHGPCGCDCPRDPETGQLTDDE